MRAAAAVLAALAAAGVAPAAEPLRAVSLPSPVIALTAVPPLLVAQQAVVETEAAVVTVSRVRTRQRVVVGIDGEGHVRTVEDTYRLLLDGKADYSFVVGAPLVSVEAAPGSATEPGQRRDALLWQGFSPGRRVLAARAVLRAADATGGLPVGMQVERQGAGTTLRLVNRTRTRVSTVTAEPVAADITRLLDDLRRGRVLRQPFVTIRGETAARSLDVWATMRVDGRARAGNGPWTRVAGELADRPLSIPLRGSGLLEVQIEARLLDPAKRPAPPPGAAPRALFDLAVRTLLETARTRQFNSFLQVTPLDPDPQAVYVYRTASDAPPAAQPAAREDDDGGNGRTALFVVVGLLGAAALAVAWAHS